MYEATSQRAPSSSQFAGLGTAAVVTAIVGYALATGFANQFVKAEPEPLMFTALPDAKPVEAPPPETKVDDVSLEATKPLAPEWPKWLPDDPPPSDGLKGEPPTETHANPPPAGVGSGTAKPLPLRIAPKLKAFDKPDYPAAEVRAQHEGVTTLEVCVGANGRVTSGSIATSSGYPRLDDAALKWLKDQRFAPATVDGVAQAMCGHKVANTWELKDAHR